MRPPGRDLSRLALAVLAAGLLAGLWPAASRAQGGAATLRLALAAPAICLGESAAVDVWLDGGAGYYGVELRLSCDPAALGLPDGQVTPLWEVLSADKHIVLKNQAGWCDDGSGHTWYGVWYAAANVSPAPAASGGGRLCTVRLTGLAAGPTTLHVLAAAGADDHGAGLTPGTADATVIVLPITATPAPTPTSTRTPTPAATPMATATPTATPTATTTRTPSATPTRTSTATARPAAPSASPSRAPVALLPAGGATATLAGTGTPTTSALPVASAAPPAPAAPPAASGDWLGWAPLVLPFLVGASLTRGWLWLRGRRRRPGSA